jgi:hypothetical protein
MDPGENAERDEGRQFPAAFAIGLVIVLILAGGLVLVTHLTRPKGPAAGDKLPFGPDEQAYAEQIHFQSGEMSQSSNLLNQEFIYVAGTVSNGGTRTVRALEVQFEFRDPFNQIILRDTQRIVAPQAQPLKPGDARDFQITLGQHLPSEWNRQYPAVRVTGLVLE